MSGSYNKWLYLTSQRASVTFRQAQIAGDVQLASELVNAGVGGSGTRYDDLHHKDMNYLAPNSLAKKSLLNHFSDFLDNFRVS